MDDESVLQLIKGGESEQIERKEQLKNKKTEVCRAICAFANDFPRTGRPGLSSSGSTTGAMRPGCRSLTNCSASFPTCGTTASSCPSRR